MSDTTESAARRLRQGSPTVDAVCRQLERQVDPSEVALVLEFAEIFLAKAPSEFIHERSTDALAHLVLGAFRFLQRARPDRVDVEVGNPDVGDEGWYAPVTLIRTNITERPFIVDSIREFLHSQGLAIEYIIYPVLHVERNDDGEVVAVRPLREGEKRESHIHCEVVQVTDAAARESLRSELVRRLEDVRRATDAFAPMVAQVNEVVAELAELGRVREERRDEVEEIQAFLRWLRDGGFVFLGYRGYDIVDRQGEGPCINVSAGSGLGVLDNEGESQFAKPVPVSTLSESQREIVERGPALIISKTNAESTVHRRARMDYIGVKKVGADGTVLGEHRFVGLFTSKAYTEDAENIPILRLKLRQILASLEVREGSHDYKETITIFNSLPKEELFLTSAEEVGADIRTVLTSYNTAGVRVTLREDPLRRGVSMMVILPKDRFSGDVRKGIENALMKTFEGEILNYHLALGAGDQARLHFYLATRPDRVEAAEVEELEQMVSHIIRSWADRVRDGLERIRSSDEARRLAQRYGEDFSPEYQAATDPSVAVGDIIELETMAAEQRPISIGFARESVAVAAPGVKGVTELKVYVRGDRLVLSDFMPILENTGLRVLAVAPFDVGGEGPGRASIYAFAVQDGEGRPLDIEGRGALLAETILAVRNGDALNDSLNKLVLGAGLQWREVDVLRAYTGYAFQTGAVPSRLALPNALVKYPGIAGELFELFQARFDPSTGWDIDERKEVANDIRSAFFGSLGGVTVLADDRALRRMEMLITGTLRTNFFRRGGRVPTARSGGVPYLSFKFSSADIEFLRQTRLRYEVWVHSSRMEGVHLRGAKVARGGIRWSDRPDDFRTEILGLVKTQVVKNAVIVPSGSKGGFIVRRQIDDADARFAEARDQYRTLVRGLLDLTDNLEPSGATVPPTDVVCFDEPDPYLVVAADKGTATFSDVANGISAEYGFWLGDAFASGGSNGYDHKAVGITARGAWECVKRHFREKDKNIQEEPFTVVGVGDMSGDVFGNGMLLSRQIRLIAAFDHRHIFIDPDPDPAPTYAERERMFALGRSSWADYDQSLLSEGGMIVPRGAKEVELSPQARSALGLPEDAPSVMDGESLIRAVLCAPVELLWNGGIGTYVKSRTETHAEAGDPANDAVRINTDDLRCEVLGEGGNLGFTQRARIEFGLRGGRVNTDAMDNSGGVDMSDHEVNLKILLTPAVAEGRMSGERRNELLEELTEEVARLVLDDNRSQSLAISLDEHRARESSDEFRDLMVALEKSGELNRAGEGLPSTDVLVERAERGQTLARPELCVLLAYAKLSLKTSLLRGALTEDPITTGYLQNYFPERAIEAAGADALQGHRLRREIIAGQVTNDLVDLMGATFVNRLTRDMGRSAEEVVRAWLVASRLADHRALLEEMGRQQSAMNAAVSYRWLLGLSRVLERSTRWVLHNVDPGASPAQIVAESAAGLASLRAGFTDLVAGEDRTLFKERVREIQVLGADESFSQALITLRFLDQLLEILRIARDTGAEPMTTGKAYYAVSEILDVPWLRRIAFASASAGPWERRAARALAQDLSRVHRRLVVTTVGQAQGGDVTKAAKKMVAGASRELERFRGVVAELRAEDVAGLAGASVAIRELSALSDRVSR
ncbi:MAG TPA: NAD-glutamate dehydrogenase domain-containing protein [Longimicrobiales bacterium]|nr:NAD-glutamate dehydrogenase domain-containing protein [Longimicrobiales bacterium]